MNPHLTRLVRGEDRRELKSSGFACDKSVRSIVCVSTQLVRIQTNNNNMTVYVPFDESLERETTIKPYARQEDELKLISSVHILQRANATTLPPCEYDHKVPAVIFSSGNTGNVFHEMNEIIIPLYITTKRVQSHVLFILEDYNPSFVRKYEKILSRLSHFEIMNPATNRSVHCFPGSVVGLKYHDNLALDSNDVPGGYYMSDFKHFLKRAYSLKFDHISQIKKPRLLLLSRTNTRRFLNEDEMVSMMKSLGIEVLVVRRSKIVSNLASFTRMINSCSVLVGVHGAGLTNEVFLPSGAVMVQVELLGTEWASRVYYGDTARAMGVHYLRYKIEAEESSLLKLYGRNHSVITDPGSVNMQRVVYLDQQNVRINVERFRETIVKALSIVTDLDK